MLFAMLEAAGLTPSEAGRVEEAPSRGTYYQWREGQAMSPVRTLLALARSNEGAMRLLLTTLSAKIEDIRARQDPELQSYVAALARGWSSVEKRRDLRKALDLGLKAAGIEADSEAPAASA